MKTSPFSWRTALKNPQEYRAQWFGLTTITLVMLVIICLFVWASGALSPQRLSPNQLVDALEKTGGKHPGYRRNHAKGVCVVGDFISNGNASTLSRAQVFAAGETPVIGRLAIAGGNPNASDAAVPVRSMALEFTTPDGQQWRTGMNALPFFAVSTPQGFYDQQVAARPDPTTGKPDPAKMKAFLAAHPEAQAFLSWIKQQVPSSSWANDRYNSLNAFRFTNAQGQIQNVRWSMVPQTPYTAISDTDKNNANFLQQDLRQRLAQGPLKWDLIITVAQPADPTNDATKAWPAERQNINAGTLVINTTQDQAEGPCNDINYDPLILPQGISGSDDPLLSARSAAYSASYNRRVHEQVSVTQGAKP